MPAGLHALFAAHPNGIDRNAAREYPLIENLGCRKIRNGRNIKRDEIGAFSIFQTISRRQSPAAALKSLPEEFFARGMAGIGNDIACPMREALRIFERSQFFRHGNQNVGIRSDAIMAVFSEKRRSRKDAVAEIGFRDRAKTGNSTAFCHASRFGFRHVRRMNKAPAAIDRRVFKQPFHRSRTGKGERIFHFFRLFRHMNMDRPAFCQRLDGCQLVAGHRTQAVRRDPERGTRQPVHHGLRALHQLSVTVERMNETLLPVDWRLAAETGMGIKDRQQGEADTRLRGGRADTFGHFGDIAVMRAIPVIMQIVKFSNPPETGLEHFHIKLGGNRLDMVRRHGEREFIHDGAPAPETVIAGTTDFGKPGHGPLKGVAVKIWHGRDDDGMSLILRLRGNAGFYG